MIPGTGVAITTSQSFTRLQKVPAGSTHMMLQEQLGKGREATSLDLFGGD